MKPSHLITHPFPAVPSDLPPATQNMVTALESKLVESRQARVLITLDAHEHLDLFLVCVERLLRFTKSQHLLLLTSASAQPRLLRSWQSALAKDDGRRLIEHFPTCSPLKLPLAPQMRVCLSTIRELQLQQIEYAQRITHLFDILVVSDLPARLSPVWKRVIEKQESAYLIAFCTNPRQAVIEWFDGQLIEEEGAEGTTQPGFTRWSPSH